MLKFKLSLLIQNAKFKAAVATLLIAAIIAGIVYIPKNKASKTTSSTSSTNYTLNASEVIAKSLELAGKIYAGGEDSGVSGKGYDGNLWSTTYNASKLATASQIYASNTNARLRGVDCSGLVFWTLSSLMKNKSITVGTKGFSYNNLVPVDTAHWLADANGKTITKSSNVTFNGQKINILKANDEITSSMRYYQYKDANGNIVDLPNGTIVVTDGKNYVSGGQNHAWIYIGDLGTSNATEVKNILKTRYGVDVAASAIKSVGSNTHWRIEASGVSGVVINNADPNRGTSEGKKAVGNIWAYQLANDEITTGSYTVELVKVKEDGTTVITSSEATFTVNGSDKSTTKGVLTVASGKTITDVSQKDTYTIVEKEAPEGYNKYEGTITLNVGFKKNVSTNKYVIDGSKTNITAPGISGNVFKISDDLTKITVYVPNTEIPEEPEGKYSVELVKVKEDGTTVITSSEATFEVNGKTAETKSGKLTVVSNKTIENVEQKDTYTIKEIKAPEGYEKFTGTLTLNIAFKLDEATNTYIIDRSQLTSKGFNEGTKYSISIDNKKVYIYVVNEEIPDEPEIHKGIKTVENQDAGYYYKDINTDKTYTEEELNNVLHKWVIETSIEEGIEKYNKYVVTDKVDTSKLDFAGLDNVVVTLVDLEGNEKALKLNEDYKVAYEEDTLKVTYIDNEFNSKTIKDAEVGSLTGYKLRVVFNTTFKVVDGKLAVLTDSVENAENQAVLTYDNGFGKETDLKSETPEVHTGAVSVFKYDDANGNGVHDKGEKALVGAEFKIAESKADAEAGKFVKDANGNDIVAISNEHGVATFTGLEFGGDATVNGTKNSDGTYSYDWENASKDYYIVETKAPAGYLLMSEGVNVTVSKNSSECIDLTDKMETYANQAITGTYNFTITKKDAETTKIIEDETTVFAIKIYSDVNEDGTFSEENLVTIQDIKGNVIDTSSIHAKTNGIVTIANIAITESEKKAGTYYFVIEETQAPDQYTEIDYRVVVPIKFELDGTEYVAKHDSANSYTLVKNSQGKEVKKTLKEMASNNNECTSTEQTDVTINVNVPNKHKEFDLSLRKFISAVNDIEPEISREPVVDTTALASGESTTATYNHTKEPLDVNTTDIVTYTFRIYNEGEIDGYATQIIDDIPEGLEFVPETATNKKYGWVMYKEVSEDTENAFTFDNKKYVITTDATEADIIATNYLAKENGKENLIKAFDGKTLSYKDVKADFKVVEPTTSDRIITNHSQITKHTDSNGTPITDRDSTPNVWNEGEDDQDIENIKVRYFDLSLLKYVTKAIVTENGKTSIIETGHTGYENPEPVVKVDLQKANLNNVTVKFEYTIKITNDGEEGSAVAGYAKEISDYVPEGLKFLPEDNENWTEVDGKIVTDALADVLLQPGESAEVTVILTWINGENNMGLKTNTAEISKDYNEYGTPDIDSTPNNKVPGEDDIDDAPVMLTVRTGMPKQYYGVAFGILLIITAGVVVIKKKVIA